MSDDPRPTPSDPPWLIRARAELHKATREIRGPGVNPIIASYYETMGLDPSKVDDDGQPWCAVFASAILKREGIAPPKRWRAARAFMEWGHACEQKLGAVCALWRDDPHGPHGHVGFFLYEQDGKVYLLAGNQGNQVSVHGFPVARVLGYRWPG